MEDADRGRLLPALQLAVALDQGGCGDGEEGAAIREAGPGIGVVAEVVLAQVEPAGQGAGMGGELLEAVGIAVDQVLGLAPAGTGLCGCRCQLHRCARRG